MKNKLQRAAQQYLEADFSVIPIYYKQKKCSLPSWKEFQEVKADETLIEKWFHKDDTNIAIITGNISGIVSVDLDSEDAISWAENHLPTTPLKIITSRGQQWIYRIPKGLTVRNAVRVSIGGARKKIDIRGDGGYILAPPSVHPDGTEYQFSKEFSLDGLKGAPMFDPSWFGIDNTGQSSLDKSELNPNILNFVEGYPRAVESNGGDDLTFKLCCELVKDYSLSVSEALPYLKVWNQKCLPPWPEKDLIEKLKNAEKYGRGETKRSQSFITLTPLNKLFEEPEEKVEWLWDERLTSTGFSILAGKPKTGKTTFARQLASAVARGEPILGWKTSQGPVIYVAAEENRSQFTKSLRKLGLKGEEPIFVSTGLPPKDFLPQLYALAKVISPKLIIFDTLFKVLSVKDGNSYAEMNEALAPLNELAAQLQCQVLVTHHLGKMDRDGADGILGSTAIFGGVDCAIILEKKQEETLIRTQQRYGEHLEDHILEFDPETKIVHLGPSKKAAKRKSIRNQIETFMRQTQRPVTQDEIFQEIEGTKGTISKALEELISTKQLTREGRGKKGDPYMYSTLF